MADVDDGSAWNESPGETAPTQLCFEDTFDPFEKLNSINNSSVNSKDGRGDADQESEKYLISLELKLRKLQGRAQCANAKDMLKLLKNAKEGQLSVTVDDDASGQQYYSTYGIEEDKVTSHAVRRKVFPEQPLTAEEIQCLLERDYLNNLTQGMHQTPGSEKKQSL